MNNKQARHRSPVLRSVRPHLLRQLAVSSEPGDWFQASPVIINYPADPRCDEIKAVCTEELDFILKKEEEIGKESHLIKVGFAARVTSG